MTDGYNVIFSAVVVSVGCYVFGGISLLFVVPRNQESSKTLECLVGGALGLVLMVSRIAGIAPLRLVRRRTQWLIRVSPFMVAYSYIFITALNVAILAALVIDLSTEPSESVRVGTPMTRAVWIADVLVVGAISSVGVYAAPSRMRDTIKCLTELQQVKLEIKLYVGLASEEKCSGLIEMSSLGGIVALLVVDYYKNSYTKLESGKYLVVSMYSCYYYQYVLVALVVMQFTLTALEVQRALGDVNNALSRILQNTHNKTDFTAADKIFYKINFAPKIYNHTKSISAAVDMMTPWSNTDYKDQDTIRNLAHTFGTLCDLVRHVDRCYGLILLLLLISTLLHLVVTPYYIITENLLGGTLLALGLLMQLGWCAFHGGVMLAVVEPCHRTQQQITETQLVLSRLMRDLKPHEALYTELEMFSRQVALTNARYSPLGMCVLARPVIATIIGGVTTYLVIIIQFQNL